MSLIADIERKGFAPSSRRGFDTILGGQNATHVFGDYQDQYFCESSIVDIFDVENGQGSLRAELHDRDLLQSIEVLSSSQASYVHRCG